MIRPRSKHPRLVDRDYEIIDHLKRYHMTTREVLQPLFFPDSELNAVTKVTSRLVDHGFLTRCTLYSDKTYFVIGPATAKLLGISAKKCKALGPQALVESYAMLQYCCLGKLPRERLLVKEVQKNLGNIQGKHLQLSKHYVDVEGTCRTLTLMRVDHGSEPAHILRRIRAFLENAVSHPKIAELVTARLYSIAIITSEEEKVTQIQDAILRQSWPVTFRVEAVPGLTALLSANIQSRLRIGDAANDS